MKNKIYLFLALLSFEVSSATYVSGVATKITGVHTFHYTTGQGDIKIDVENTVPGCEAGYFITAENPSLNNALSTALSAFYSGAKVTIGGQSGIRWSATSRTDYCYVHSISVVK